MSTTVVPRLHLSTPPAASPPSARKLYSPRTEHSYTLFSPRTPREQLELTGSQIGEALAAAAELQQALKAIRARAESQRASFVEKNPADPNYSLSCPICLETMADSSASRSVVACENAHRFCYDCLSRHRRHSRNFLCPLCRVPIADAVLAIE